MKAQWAEDYLAWNRRGLSKEHYVYVWADGIYSTLRGEDDRLYPKGHKMPIGHHWRQRTG